MRTDKRRFGVSGLSLMISLAAVGCGAEEVAQPGSGSAGTPSLPGSPAAGAPSTAAPSAPAASPASPGAAPTAPTGQTAAPTAQNVPGVPCDVAEVVSQNCTLCHAAKPTFNAPMALMTLADFQAAAHSDPAKKVYETIPPRLNATDIKLRMPPASGAALTPAGLKALNDWVTAGAAPVTPSCAITAPTAPGATPPTGNPEQPGVEQAPGATVVPMGVSSSTPIVYNDPLMKCYEFRAHVAGNDAMPFAVANTPDLYTNFTFAAPWTGM